MSNEVDGINFRRLNSSVESVNKLIKWSFVTISAGIFVGSSTASLIR